jgi:hypothetical protein
MLCIGCARSDGRVGAVVTEESRVDRAVSKTPTRARFGSPTSRASITRLGPRKREGEERRRSAHSYAIALPLQGEGGCYRAATKERCRLKDNAQKENARGERAFSGTCQLGGKLGLPTSTRRFGGLVKRRVNSLKSYRTIEVSELVTATALPALMMRAWV